MLIYKGSRRDSRRLGFVLGIEVGQKVEKEVPEVFRSLCQQIVERPGPAAQRRYAGGIQRTARDLLNLLGCNGGKWMRRTKSAQRIDAEVAVRGENDFWQRPGRKRVLDFAGYVAIDAPEVDNRGALDFLLQFV